MFFLFRVVFFLVGVFGGITSGTFSFAFVVVGLRGAFLAGFFVGAFFTGAFLIAGFVFPNLPSVVAVGLVATNAFILAFGNGFLATNDVLIALTSTSGMVKAPSAAAEDILIFDAFPTRIIVFFLADVICFVCDIASVIDFGDCDTFASTPTSIAYFLRYSISFAVLNMSAFCFSYV